MAEQASMFTPTPEQALENLTRFWEQRLAFEFSFVEAVGGVPAPEGMVPALARLLARFEHPLDLDDSQMGCLLLLMSQAYEEGVLFERQHGERGSGCGGR